MKISSGNILLIGQGLEATQMASLASRFSILDNPSVSSLKALSCEVGSIENCPEITTSLPEQAADSARTKQPHLVILLGDDCQSWSPYVAKQIKQSVRPGNVTVVTLMESSEQSWIPEADTAIDGCFVKPMSSDILSALHTSARLKQSVAI